MGDKGVPIELLLAFGAGPHQHPEEVQERLGEKTRLPVEINRGRALPLAQLGAVLVVVAQERHMPERGRCPAEGLVEQQVLRERRDPFLAADHIGDLHPVVVHHIGEVVGRETVRLQQHRVVHRGPVLRKTRAEPVRKLDDPRGRSAQPHRAGAVGVFAVVPIRPPPASSRSAASRQPSTRSLCR